MLSVLKLPEGRQTVILQCRFPSGLSFEMTNIYSSQIPPPRNWQDFETLCRDLWANIWNDPNTQKNGRSGQPQHGVDIVGMPRDTGCFHGVQCKGKNNYTNSALTVQELKEEVQKALHFRPGIRSFTLVTTSAKDANLEKLAREITVENLRNGGFSVHVLGWDEVVEEMAGYPEIVKKYYSWAFPAGDPGQSLFEFWITEAQIATLKVNANILPFQSFNVCFRGSFINALQSYLLKFEVHEKSPPACDAPDFLKRAIYNFNDVARDLLTVCHLYKNKYDLKSDIYTYWVDVDALQYHEKGKFIEFRKGVLKTLFFNLIKSANFVIQIRRSLLTGNHDVTPFIGFVADFGYAFPFFGSPHPSPEFYPVYAEVEGKVNLYGGLNRIEVDVKDQIYDNA